MSAEGGLGRSLADIRADLEAVRSDDEKALGLFAALERLTEGAEPRGPEFAQLTAGEAWGMLLEMPPDKRLAWLGNVLEGARDGSMCHDQNHRGRIASLEERALPLLTVRAEDIEHNPGDIVARLKNANEDFKAHREAIAKSYADEAADEEGPADA